MRKSVSQVLNKLKSQFGELLLPKQQIAEHTVQGHAPLAVVQPETEAQVSEMVGLCLSGDVIVVAAGAEHQLTDLHAEGDDRPLLLISTRKLRQVVDYSYEDMTITVQSGVLLSELDEITTGFGQQLPIDPPCSETATVGGLVATNTSGPRRLMHGSTADSILGGAMVLADGTLVKSGAKTVKSVAGYDLHKLFVGSYGSLGIITQIALKLKPIPDDFRVIEIRADSMSDAEYISGQLLRGQTRPSMIQLYNHLGVVGLGRSADRGEGVLYVAYEDTTDAVEWQVEQLQATHGTSMMAFGQADSLDCYKAIVEWPTQACEFAFEVAVLGARWDALMEYCSEQNIAALACAGSGIVQGCGVGGPTREIADTLRSLAGPGGTLRFRLLPKDTTVSRWGEMDQARRWMRAVKEKFDPQCIFPWPGFLGTM